MRVVLLLCFFGICMISTFACMYVHISYTYLRHTHIYIYISTYFNFTYKIKVHIDDLLTYVYICNVTQRNVT